MRSVPICVCDRKCAARLGELAGLPCCLSAWCCACMHNNSNIGPWLLLACWSFCHPCQSTCTHPNNGASCIKSSQNEGGGPTCAATSSALLYTFSCQLNVLTTLKASGRPDVLAMGAAAVAASGLSPAAAVPACALLLVACRPQVNCSTVGHQTIVVQLLLKVLQV